MIVTIAKLKFGGSNHKLILINNLSAGNPADTKNIKLNEKSIYYTSYTNLLLKRYFPNGYFIISPRI